MSDDDEDDQSAVVKDITPLIHIPSGVLEEETKDDILMESNGRADDGERSSRVFAKEEEEETKDESTKSKVKLEESGVKYQPLANGGREGRKATSTSLSSSNPSIGGLHGAGDGTEGHDEDAVVSLTSLRRGEQLAHLVPVAPGAVSIFPSTHTMSSEDEEQHQSSFDDTIPTGDISSGASNQQQHVPEATAVQERPVVLAVRQSQTYREEDNTTTRKGCSRRALLVAGLVLLIVIGAIVTVVAVVATGKNNSSPPQGYPVLITLAPSAAPSGAPSMSPSPSLSPSKTFKADLVELIQARSPKTHFLASDVAAAFDWILSDPYSLALEGDGDRLLQRFALATLWFALGLEASSRSAFEGWMQPTDECGWDDSGINPTIGCNQDGLVAFLALVKNDAKGSIPAETFLLSGLEELGLFANPLTGSIPSQLSLLTALTALQIGEDALTGTIPSELWPSLSNLDFLRIGFNPEMSPSTIPSSVSSLSKLKLLSLNGVHLSGSIPTEVGSLSALTRLDFEFCNGLTGSIPTHFGMLSKLSRLEVTGNQLSGPIPTEFGLLGSLRGLFLALNSFTGTIPTELGSLRDLTQLVIGPNGSVTGQIPTNVGLLTHLSLLDVAGNQLTGPIPTEVGLLKSLDTLALGQNSFSSAIPTEFGELSHLSWLSLNYSGVTGTIPTEIGQLKMLTFLFLGRNRQLEGTIPSQIYRLSELVTLSLGGGDYYSMMRQSAIPTEIGLLTNLEVLDLSGSNLTGTIPTALALLQDLVAVGFGNNRLTGTIPSELTLLTHLTQLALGPIGSTPPESDMPEDLDLYLNTDGLVGTLMTEIGLLRQLEELLLGNNDLTGTLPTELGLLTSLGNLSLSNNHFSGSVPSELASLTLLMNGLHLETTGLTGSIPDSLCGTTVDVFVECEEIECSCCICWT